MDTRRFNQFFVVGVLYIPIGMAVSITELEARYWDNGQERIEAHLWHVGVEHFSCGM